MNLTATPYFSSPAFIPNPGLNLPDASYFHLKENSSFDSSFDQSPDLKDVTPSFKKKVKHVYSTITPSVVSVSSFQGNANQSFPLIRSITVCMLLVWYVFFVFLILLGVRRRIDCSGLIISWNSSEKEATILTSAKLLWRPKRSSFEFYLIVRTVDGSLLLAREDRVDYYYNLVTLKVRSTVELKPLDLRSRLNDILADDMDVIALGRQFYTCSLCDYAGKLHLDYPYFGCTELLTSTCHIPGFCEGGPLISHTGCVVGINFSHNGAHPLPTSVILTCLEMWNCFSTVVRPWIGVSVVDVDQLSYGIWERYNLVCDESYVVVKEVYEGSLADKNGVCSGDLVATCNGIPIRSAKQYSQLLSERSRTMTTSGDLVHQNFTVVIKPFEHLTRLALRLTTLRLMTRRSMFVGHELKLIGLTVKLDRKIFLSSIDFRDQCLVCIW